MIYVKTSSISRATLSRLPEYLIYLKTLDPKEHTTVSATAIAKATNCGEMQVRKDLNFVSKSGRPRIGYLTEDLIACLEQILHPKKMRQAILIGTGKLDRAILDYGGFDTYGIKIAAVFKPEEMYQAAEFIKKNHIKVGIIAVPIEMAQNVCDAMTAPGIKAIWNLSPCFLKVPKGIYVRHDNLALSLAHLTMSVED